MRTHTDVYKRQVHINTLKGKGYEPAEQDKETYHWRTPFDLETGKSKMNDEAEDYSCLLYTSYPG